MQDDTLKQTSDQTMRAATMLLGFCGCACALAGLGMLLLGLGVLAHIESGMELFKAVSMIALMLSGFWIWYGWLLYSFKQRFPVASVRTFWLVSLIHHLVWILLLIPMDVWGGGDDPWWIPLWVIGNVVIATVFVFRDLRNNQS